MGEKELTIKDALDFAVGRHNEGKLREAENIYRKILEKEPNNADALHLMGLIAHQEGKYEEAVRNISRAIELKPGCAFYYGNLGMTYDELGKEKESAENFKKALEINPKYNKAYLANYNLGVYFKDKGKVMDALEYYDRAIELKGDFFDAHWNRSLILLLLGKFKEGWEEYECRFKKENPSDSRVFNKPKWDGSSLKSEKILIVSEQGFGDDIQFIRYLPLVKEKGGHVILECKKELKRLFEDCLFIDEIIEKEDNNIPNINFDFYIHLMSLPGVFNTGLENIPWKESYLRADRGLVEEFKEKIKSDKFKIGIVWAGNPEQENDKNRSMSFEKFKCLAGISGVELFSLQKGGASEQLNDSRIINIAGEMHDFADTAAVIENMDLIISVDTSVAHLAGAMGKPVWTLLTFMPDWRWLLERKDCLWYPTMELFRQKKSGDWDSLMRDVRQELGKYVNFR